MSFFHRNYVTRLARQKFPVPVNLRRAFTLIGLLIVIAIHVIWSLAMRA